MQERSAYCYSAIYTTQFLIWGYNVNIKVIANRLWLFVFKKVRFLVREKML